MSPKHLEQTTISSHPPELWDKVAQNYDAMRPDQGLTDPDVKAAWQALLVRFVPSEPSRILDIGCGTGSLSLLLALTGHDVVGIDYSPEMIGAAKQKAASARSNAQFYIQDAANPQFEPEQFDLLICRQVLWVFSDTKSVLTTWANLLKPDAPLVMIEGLFASGNGIASDAIRASLPTGLKLICEEDLSKNHTLWGGLITDERNLLVAARASSRASADGAKYVRSAEQTSHP